MQCILTLRRPRRGSRVKHLRRVVPCKMGQTKRRSPIMHLSQTPRWPLMTRYGNTASSQILTVLTSLSKSDGVDSVLILVKVTPECPGGLKDALIFYSESEDESYIRKTTCEKYGLLPGPDGKVNVRYYPKGSRKTAVEKCNIKLDDDGDADLVFARKPIEEAEAGPTQPPGKCYWHRHKHEH